MSTIFYQSDHLTITRVSNGRDGKGQSLGTRLVVDYMGHESFNVLDKDDARTIAAGLENWADNEPD